MGPRVQTRRIREWGGGSDNSHIQIDRGRQEYIQIQREYKQIQTGYKQIQREYKQIKREYTNTKRIYTNTKAAENTNPQKKRIPTVLGGQIQIQIQIQIQKKQIQIQINTYYIQTHALPLLPLWYALKLNDAYTNTNTNVYRNTIR